MTGNIVWLQRWYLSQWRQDRDARQPGWQLLIDLHGTDLADLPFTAQKIERTEADWLRCRVADEKFQAACGPENLEEALSAFRQWVTKSAPG
jgi:hypothetical protein